MSIPAVVAGAGKAYLKSQGIELDPTKPPSLKTAATASLSTYLVSCGVPPQISTQVAEQVTNRVMDGKLPAIPDIFPTSNEGVKDEVKKQITKFLSDKGVNSATIQQVIDKGTDVIKNLPNIAIQDPSIIEKVLPPETVEKPAAEVNPDGSKTQAKSIGVVGSTERKQDANEAVDINRKIKHAVKGFLPPMNWWDMLPDWPPISYTAIIMDQTRAAKKWIGDGLPQEDEIAAEIESRKYPYKSIEISTLTKNQIDPSSKTTVLGHELLQLKMDADTIKDTKPTTATYSDSIISTTTQTNTKYVPVDPVLEFLNPYRDDVTDQKHPALDLLDTQRLVDEFLIIGSRIYDSQTENPKIFGFDDIVSKYEKDKNIVLANLKQYKANIKRMERLNDIVENKSNLYLIEKIDYRKSTTQSSCKEEFATRYLREKLLAWYNEVDDPETKVWSEHHWLSGEPGYVESLLKVGDYEWFNNLAAGLEDSTARLEDIESCLNLMASMANVASTIQKYKTAIENAEIIVEDPEWEGSVVFTETIIDWTMLEPLLGVSTIVGDAEGELTPLREELKSLRQDNQSMLEEVREMDPSTDAYPIIWSRLNELCTQVNTDIDAYLNTLILDKLGDHETEGWHCSPSHLMLDISKQLALIVETIMEDVCNIIKAQILLPKKGLHRLDSMLNKINEIRLWGPMCAIPFHYQMAIDNVNAAERLYNDIWSDVFDCWEREYIVRNWRILYEHHIGGVIPASFYGKPLFSAECPHHLPLLEAPVPIDYRDIDIKYLSANCRKNFLFLCSWLTSALYAIGTKRVALAMVINDTSLNGNDENMEQLGELNTLNSKNLKIKDEIDTLIKTYDGPGGLLSKMDLDEIVAAKELSPTLYSNQTLLNLSSQLHLLNTEPITELNVATNENRTGTTVTPSEALEWETVIPAGMSADGSEIAGKNLVDELEVKTILTNGGDAEVILPLEVTSDSENFETGHYVGDIEEFEPWYHGMTPEWDTQRSKKELPVVIPPEIPVTVPDSQIINMPTTETISIKPVEILNPAAVSIPGWRDEKSTEVVKKDTLIGEESNGANLSSKAREKSRKIDALFGKLLNDSTLKDQNNDNIR